MKNKNKVVELNEYLFVSQYVINEDHDLDVSCLTRINFLCYLNNSSLIELSLCF